MQPWGGDNAGSLACCPASSAPPPLPRHHRLLPYSTFRDFPAEHLLPADSSSPAAAGAASAADSSGSPAYRLNPWQIRHATLVVQALKEVNELRYVLCPK